MHAPDPIVTASVFCNGRLDRVIHQVAAPWLAAVRALDPGAEWGLWWVRYSKNGDHLKLRLHGPGGRADEARRLLAGAADAFFATLSPADPDEKRITRAGIPAIDAEDGATDDYPDRTLLWTTYARSYVSFGPRHLLANDAYVARVTTCLARGAEVVLDATSLDDGGSIPATARQRAVLRALLPALPRAAEGPEERRAYLAYHRDWLVRFSAPDSAREADVLAGFDRQLAGMRATVDQLARVAAAHWSPSAAPAADAKAARYSAAVAELSRFAAPFRHDPEHPGDPFTDDASYPLVFKALHGVANQAGLNLLNEAFLYHLVLRVAAAVDAPLPVGA